MSGDFYVDANVEIAGTVALNIFHALSLEAEHGARLGAGRDSDGAFAVEGRHVAVGAESGLHEAHRHFTAQVVAVALEDFMRSDVEDDVEVARGSAARAGFAIAGRPQTRAGIDTGGDA